MPNFAGNYFEIPHGPYRSKTELPPGCSVKNEKILLPDGQTLCDFDAWANDRSGVLTGLAEGVVTLDELYACARRAFETLLSIC